VLLRGGAGDLVAVKKQTRNTKALERYLTRELAALKNLQHDNLIEFLGCVLVTRATGVDLPVATSPPPLLDHLLRQGVQCERRGAGATAVIRRLHSHGKYQTLRQLHLLKHWCYRQIQSIKVTVHNDNL
jgi:hypothetical protein